MSIIELVVKQIISFNPKISPGHILLQKNRLNNLLKNK